MIGLATSLISAVAPPPIDFIGAIAGSLIGSILGPLMNPPTIDYDKLAYEQVESQIQITMNTLNNVYGFSNTMLDTVNNIQQGQIFSYFTQAVYNQSQQQVLTDIVTLYNKFKTGGDGSSFGVAILPLPEEQVYQYFSAPFAGGTGGLYNLEAYFGSRSGSAHNPDSVYQATVQLETLLLNSNQFWQTINSNYQHILNVIAGDDANSKYLNIVAANSLLAGMQTVYMNAITSLYYITLVKMAVIANNYSAFSADGTESSPLAQWVQFPFSVTLNTGQVGYNQSVINAKKYFEGKLFDAYAKIFGGYLMQQDSKGYVINSSGTVDISSTKVSEIIQPATAAAGTYLNGLLYSVKVTNGNLQGTVTDPAGNNPQTYNLGGVPAANSLNLQVVSDGNSLYIAYPNLSNNIVVMQYQANFSNGVKISNVSTSGVPANIVLQMSNGTPQVNYVFSDGTTDLEYNGKIYHAQKSSVDSRILLTTCGSSCNQNTISGVYTINPETVKLMSTNGFRSGDLLLQYLDYSSSITKAQALFYGSPTNVVPMAILNAEGYTYYAVKDSGNAYIYIYKCSGNACSSALVVNGRTNNNASIKLALSGSDVVMTFDVYGGSSPVTFVGGDINNQE